MQAVEGDWGPDTYHHFSVWQDTWQLLSAQARTVLSFTSEVLFQMRKAFEVEKMEWKLNTSITCTVGSYCG